MSQSENFSFEQRKPYIASALTGVLSYVVTASYLQTQLGSFFVLLIIVSLFLVFASFNLWSFYGALLVGIILEVTSRRGFESANGLVVIFIFGTVASLIIEKWRQSVRKNPETSKKSGEADLSKSSVMQNFYYTLVGAAISYGIVYLIIAPNVDHQRPTIEVIFLIFIFSPITFGALFAAASQVNFSFSPINRFLRRVFMAFLGAAIFAVPFKTLIDAFPILEIPGVLFILLGISLGATLGDDRTASLV